MSAIEYPFFKQISRDILLNRRLILSITDKTSLLLLALFYLPVWTVVTAVGPGRYKIRSSILVLVKGEEK